MALASGYVITGENSAIRNSPIVSSKEFGGFRLLDAVYGEVERTVASGVHVTQSRAGKLELQL